MASHCISIKRWAAERTKDLLRLNGLIGGDRKTLETRSAVLQAFDDLWSDNHQGPSKEAIPWLRHRNSLANIHKLPLEIILIIFNLLLFTSRGSRRHQYVTRLVTLRSVSWMWREIIDHTPQFWSLLHSDDHVDFVSSSLQKSQSCSLRLEDSGRSQLWSSQVDFWTKVSQHVKRWEQVTLQRRNDGFIQRYFNLLSPRCKRLVRLQNLHTLDLENCRGLDRKTLLRVLSENSNTLTVLRLCSITFGPFTSLQQDFQQISLEVLSEIVLDASTRSFDEDMWRGETSPLTWLLKQVKIPACTRFVFKVHFWNATLAQIDGLLPFLPRPIDISSRNLQRYGAHAKPPTARVTFLTDTFSCEVYGCISVVPQYSIMLIGAFRQAGVEWTRSELAGEWLGDVELRYRTERELWPMTKMLDLKHLSTVTRLEVEGHGTRERAITESLTSILGSPGASGAFLFPILNSLTLSHREVTSGEVLELVRARFGSPPSQKQRHDEKPIHNTKADGRCFTIILDGQMARWRLETIKEFEAIPGVRVIPWSYHLELDQEDDESGLSD